MTYFEPKNDERKAIILFEVGANPGIHHNALRKIIVDSKKKMAKKTFDKLTKEMREIGTLVTRSEGDNKIHYYVRLKNNSTKDFSEDVKFFFEVFENEIKLLKKKYKKYNAAEKSALASIKLANIYSLLIGIAMMDSIEDPIKQPYNKQEIQCKKFAKQIFDIIMHDKDAAVVYPLVRDAIINNFRISNFSQLPRL